MFNLAKKYSRDRARQPTDHSTGYLVSLIQTKHEEMLFLSS